MALLKRVPWELTLPSKHKIMNKAYYCHNFYLRIRNAFLILLILQSCTDQWYDIKSDKSITVPSTVKDFELLLDDYRSISTNTPGLGEIGCDDNDCPDVSWPKMQNNQPTFNAQRNAYLWNNKMLYQEVNDWNAAYKRIFICNLVLDGLNKITSDNSTKFNQVKGNALFHRAKAYFDLSQVFIPPYDKNGDSPYGLPFPNSSDITQKLTRSSVHKTYASIISDLETAITLLPSKAAVNTRGSKHSCFALLSRIYLIQTNYPKALEFANKTIAISDSLIIFSDIPPSNRNLGMVNPETIFHSTMTNYHLTYFQNFYSIVPELYSQYEDNDLRKQIYFRIANSIISFKGMYNNSTTQFSGLATDEMYLIRSECNARLNNIELAMKDLNKLLRSRWARSLEGNTLYSDQNASSSDDAIRIILKERRKSLLMRGLRWSDLRRLNLEGIYQTTISRTVDNETFTLEPNSYRYTVPLPDDEITISNLPQNQGWKR